MKSVRDYAHDCRDGSVTGLGRVLAGACDVSTEERLDKELNMCSGCCLYINATSDVKCEVNMLIYILDILFR